MSGLGGLVEDAQPVLDGVLVVVRAAFGVGPGQDATHELVPRHVEVDDGVRAGAAVLGQPARLDGLLDRAREAVEQVAVAVGGLLHPGHDQIDDHRVGHEVAAAHDLLGLAADRGAVLDLGPQQVTGRQMLDVQPLRQALALRALARSGWADQQHVHGVTFPSSIRRATPEVPSGTPGSSGNLWMDPMDMTGWVQGQVFVQTVDEQRGRAGHRVPHRARSHLPGAHTQ